MDKRLALTEKQLDIVNRIKRVFDELKKENIAFGLYIDSDGFNAIDFINMNDVKGLDSYEDYLLDWNDPRRDCAYIDEDFRYVEPDDSAFNAEYIYYSPKECDLVGMCVKNFAYDECDEGYIASFKDWE